MARRRTLSLSEAQAQELLQLRDHDPRPYVRERAAALLKVAAGKAPHWVAAHGLLKPRDPDTVYAWLGAYQAAGAEGLVAGPQGGARRRRLRPRGSRPRAVAPGPRRGGATGDGRHPRGPAGRVHYRDGYIVGREEVVEFSGQLDRAYPDAERLLVVQDNWSIHRHPDVEAALARWPRIERVWLPTYAPWLNPIEKLWRWLRRGVLRPHRLAGDWAALRARVNGFLDQFAGGSTELLRYVGLLGEGKLARALRGP
jgi:hypothetical protein